MVLCVCVRQMGAVTVRAVVLPLALDRLGAVTQAVCSWDRARHILAGVAGSQCLQVEAQGLVVALLSRPGAVRNEQVDVYLRAQARGLHLVVATSVSSRGQHLAAPVQVATLCSLPVPQSAAIQAVLRLARTPPQVVEVVQFVLLLVVEPLVLAVCSGSPLAAARFRLVVQLILASPKGPCQAVGLLLCGRLMVA